jgi:hypothetical protein
MTKTNLYLHSVAEMKSLIRSISLENPSEWRRGILIAWLLKNFPKKYENKVVVQGQEISDRISPARNPVFCEGKKPTGVPERNLEEINFEYKYKTEMNNLTQEIGEQYLCYHTNEERNNEEFKEALEVEEKPKKSKDKYYEDEDYEEDVSEYETEDEEEDEESIS